MPKGDKKALDTFWLNTLLALIGEQFKEGGDICGVVVSVRKSQDRVCLWTKNAANEAVQMSIGQTFKETLELSPNAHLGFTTFHDQKTCVRGGDARARACAHTHEAPIAPECHADAPRVRPFPPPPPPPGLARAGNSQPGEEGSREVCVLIGLAGRQRARDQRAAPTRVAMTMAPMPVKSSSESSDTLVRGGARYWIARAPAQRVRCAIERQFPPARLASVAVGSRTCHESDRSPATDGERRRWAARPRGGRAPQPHPSPPARLSFWGGGGGGGAEAAESRSSRCNCLSH